MRIAYAAGVLNWAPVLLGSAGDFARIGKNAVAVTAVNAVNFFDRIEISKMVTVDCNVKASFDARNTVGPETDVLVDCYAQVEQSDRGDHTVDERGDQNCRNF